MATTFLAHILLWASVCGAIFGFGLTCRGLWCSDKNFYHPRWVVHPVGYGIHVHEPCHAVHAQCALGAVVSDPGYIKELRALQRAIDAFVAAYSEPVCPLMQSRIMSASAAVVYATLPLDHKARCTVLFATAGAVLELMAEEAGLPSTTVEN